VLDNPGLEVLDSLDLTVEVDSLMAARRLADSQTVADNPAPVVDILVAAADNLAKVADNLTGDNLLVDLRWEDNQAVSDTPAEVDNPSAETCILEAELDIRSAALEMADNPLVVRRCQVVGIL